MKNKRWTILLTVICLVLIVATACAKPAPTQAPATAPATAPTPSPVSQKAIELKAVQFMPPASFRGKLQATLWQKVNEAAKGELVITQLGGPEVIGSLQQGEAVAKGVVDISVLPPSFYMGMAPQGFPMILTEVTTLEEIKRGAQDYLEPFYNKANFHFWGEVLGGDVKEFYLFLNKKVEKLEDLKGVGIGGAAVMYKAMLSALGASLTVVPLEESYTAVERGMVNGYIYPFTSLDAFAGYEVMKYCIYHPFYVDYTAVIMNLDKWKSLSPALQKLLTDTLRNTMADRDKVYRAEELKWMQKAKDNGMEFLTFSPEEAQKYIKTIYDSTWEWQIGMLGEPGTKLRTMISK